MRCNSIGGRVTRLTPPCAKGVPVALAAPGSVAGAMDMDDGEGFPIETAKEKILTVAAAPDLRHTRMPRLQRCASPHTGFANPTGTDALHSREDELVGDDDHREHIEGAERDQ